MQRTFLYNQRITPIYKRLYCKHSFLRNEFIKHISDDQDNVNKFVDNLSFESRKNLIQSLLSRDSSSNHEYLKDIFNQADTNKDGLLNEEEFNNWINGRSWFRSSEYIYEDNKKGIINIDTNDKIEPTSKQLGQLFIQIAIPFVGFGFLDNAIMILAGNTIEQSIGITLGLSTLAAAGIGNLFSDVAGIGLGNSIEAGAHKLGLPNPKLTRYQEDTSKVKWIRFFSSVVGIAIGCLLGMFPLLFMHSKDEARLRRIFDGIDKNNNGVIDFFELEKACEELGISINSTELKKFFNFIDVDKNGTIDFNEFCFLVEHVSGILDPTHK